MCGRVTGNIFYFLCLNIHIMVIFGAGNRQETDIIVK
jgi:hypothetical protein